MKNERGGLVERGKALYEGGGPTHAPPLASPEAKFQFAHNLTFELSY